MPSPPEFPHYPATKESSLRIISRGWLVAAIGLVLATLVIATSSAVVFFRYGDQSFGFDAFIDDYEILDVIEPECDRMTEAVEDLLVTGTLAEQAAVIEQQNQAVSRMLETIRRLPANQLAGDEPTIEWLLDWDALIEARSEYAAELDRGHLPELEIPLDPNGDLIVDRMDWAGEPECVVPEALLDPYPVDVDDA